MTCPNCGGDMSRAEQVCSPCDRIQALEKELAAKSTEVQRYRDVLEEMARPPYHDSDPTSLLEWVRSRAKAVLEGK